MAFLAAEAMLFPSPTGNKHIGRESIEKRYRVTLGLEGKHSPHGWRGSFSTLARDNGIARDVVELALDHALDNEVVRAYDREYGLKNVSSDSIGGENNFLLLNAERQLSH